MKYVVIEIEDDGWDENLGLNLGRPFRVIGLFKKPTKFCDPSDGHRGKKTQSGWTRGTKYGWWVCAKCKKPSEGWGNNLSAVLSAARNLLVTEADRTTSDT